MRGRTGSILVLTALSAVAAFLLPGIPQPIEYHDFADHREFWSVGNFFDVTSNVGFLLAGVWGLFLVIDPRTAFEHAAERWPYGLFFAGMLLTAVGSAYYHLAPDNERLFWDRLPMTVAFMSLLAGQVVDRFDVRVGVALLPILLLIGGASAAYWRVTERAGRGNVVPYAILQAYSVVILLVIAVAHPSRYTRADDLYRVFAAYVLAKGFEAMDAQVFAYGELVSGHTLKHVAAALAGVLVCRMLSLRSLCAESVATV